MALPTTIQNRQAALGNPTAHVYVTVAAASTLVLAENKDRTHAMIQASWTNTEPLFLSFGDGILARVGYGFALYPGQHYEIGPDNHTTLTISAICTSGGMVAYVFEA